MRLTGWQRDTWGQRITFLFSFLSFFFYRSASLHFWSKSSAILSIFCFSSVLMDITLASCCCFWVSISSYKHKKVKNVRHNTPLDRLWFHLYHDIYHHLSALAICLLSNLVLNLFCRRIVHISQNPVLLSRHNRYYYSCSNRLKYTFKKYYICVFIIVTLERVDRKWSGDRERWGGDMQQRSTAGIEPCRCGYVTCILTSRLPGDVLNPILHFTSRFPEIITSFCCSRSFFYGCYDKILL